ncbi:MAG: membrane protein insertion efficiency factor YidD [Deltaproteobacteria bacterium]|nr:membrane protein insertion efficiency factor YidD [Deltaproteobacteria bacterium]
MRSSLFFLVSVINSLFVVVCTSLLKVWNRAISPCFGCHCRFEPTCSRYAIEAFKRYGFIRGLWLSIKRVVRCNPMCQGGEDLLP